MTPARPDRKLTLFELGEFRIDLLRRTITGLSGETMIEPKIMAVLLMLAESPGEVVSRQMFIDTIWSREFGGDESLTRAVSHLRKVFGDGNSNGKHSYIETIPKSGYRLIKLVRSVEAGTKWGSRRQILLSGIAVVLVVLLVYISRVYRDNGEVMDQPVSNRVDIVLAVLRFDSQGDAPEDVALAYGLADEVLSALSQSQSFSVIAGNSSFRFLGEDKKDLDTLRRQLNISHVVDGMVHRSVDGLRVRVHLVEAETKLVVWSDVLTRPESEIYTIPNEVAGSVQKALGADPVVLESRTRAPDPLAYGTYLQAKALIRATTDWNLGRAVEHLEDAVKLDPGLSEAWAAMALARLDMMVVETPKQEGKSIVEPYNPFEVARREANAALAIDPGSVDALLALVIINHRESADTLIETESRILSLLARAPNHPNVNMEMGMMLTAVGRVQAASRFLKTALDLDPLSSLISFNYVTSLFASGRWEEARDYMRKRNVYDWYRRSYPWLTMRLLEGDFNSASDFYAGLKSDNLYFTKGLGLVEAIDADSPKFIRLKGLLDRLVVAARSGDSSLDSTIGSDLVMAAHEGLIPHYHVFQLLAAAGLNDTAFDLARERLALGEKWYRVPLLMPAFGQGRHDPRVMELFAATDQLDYWLLTDNWPDFCVDRELPYDCKGVARQYRDVNPQ